MIYSEFIEYCRQQEDKPKYTTEFIKEFQQTNSGNGTYLHEAICQGKMVYKCEGEPNQKWHLLESWYKYNKGEISDKPITAWCGLRCPELLLWIAEVSGQKENVKRVVKEILKNSIYKENDREARRSMVKYIKNEINWSEIVRYIEDCKQND